MEMRSLLTSLAEVVGAGLATTGVMLVSVPAGLVAAGAALIAFGYMAGAE